MDNCTSILLFHSATAWCLSAFLTKLVIVKSQFRHDKKTELANVVDHQFFKTLTARSILSFDQHLFNPGMDYFCSGNVQNYINDAIKQYTSSPCQLHGILYARATTMLLQCLRAEHGLSRSTRSEVKVWFKLLKILTTSQLFNLFDTQQRSELTEALEEYEQLKNAAAGSSACNHYPHFNAQSLLILHAQIVYHIFSTNYGQQNTRSSLDCDSGADHIVMASYNTPPRKDNSNDNLSMSDLEGEESKELTLDQKMKITQWQSFSGSFFKKSFDVETYVNDEDDIVRFPYIEEVSLTEFEIQESSPIRAYDIFKVLIEKVTSAAYDIELQFQYVSDETETYQIEALTTMFNSLYQKCVERTQNCQKQSFHYRKRKSKKQYSPEFPKMFAENTKFLFSNIITSVFLSPDRGISSNSSSPGSIGSGNRSISSSSTAKKSKRKF